MVFNHIQSAHCKDFIIDLMSLGCFSSGLDLGEQYLKEVGYYSSSTKIDVKHLLIVIQGKDLQELGNISYS